MNQFDFHKFWRKYGNYILIGLFFLFVINLCHRPSPNRTSSPEETQQESVQDTTEDDRYLKSYEELMRERQSEQKQRPGSFLSTFVLLLLGVAIVWIARQKWAQSMWQQWFPGKVKFRVRKGKDRVTGRKLLRISIENKTREGLTFLPPNVIFSSWGKERRFRIRGNNQDEMFPLTLTPGTGQRVVLDLDQFYEKIPDLKGANRVGASIETTDGKRYKKFVLPPWLDMLLH
ncbi:MAG: hypothetical protein ACQEQ0_01120 [Bacteroidota bacterium]